MDLINENSAFDYENIVEVLKNGYQLTINNYRIKATNPIIYPFKQDCYENQKDIQRFSYDLEILIKREDKFKRLIKHHVSEFGIMQHIEEFIDYVVTYDMKNNASKKIMLKNAPFENAMECHQVFNIAGVMDEDRLDVVATYRAFEDRGKKYEFITYEVAFFIGGDETCSPVVGIKMVDLDKEDLLDIKDFAKFFMEYAEKLAKQNAQKYKTYYDNLAKGIVGPSPFED